MGIGIVTSVLGELIDPRSLNAGEELALEYYRAIQEIEDLNKRIADMEKWMQPMLDKLCIPYEWDDDRNDDNPC